MVLDLVSHLRIGKNYSDITILHLEDVHLFGKNHQNKEIRNDLDKQARRQGANYYSISLGKFGWTELLKNWRAKNLDDIDRHTILEQLRGDAGLSEGSLFGLESFALAHYSHFKSRLGHVTTWLNLAPDSKIDFFIGNGKDPITKTLLMMLGDSIHKTRYFEAMETWVPAGNCYLGDFPVHDWENHRKSAERDYRDVDRGEKNATLWTNQRGVTAAVKTVENRISRQLAIFTTSDFEFQYLSKAWKGNSFADQYQGFDHALKMFDPAGKNSIVRVHPNLMSGSFSTQISATARLLKLKRNHKQLRIVWHFQTNNSYVIMLSAEKIVVSSSTIGMEAFLSGKKVFRVGTGRYDSLDCIPHLMESSSEKGFPERGRSLLTYFELNSFPKRTRELKVNHKGTQISHRTKPIYFFQTAWRLRKSLSLRLGQYASRVLVALRDRT